MSTLVGGPARLPPPLPGLDAAWSRLVTAPDHRGDQRTWHLLDNAVTAPRLTVLCVHGNPTWSYLWRDLLAAAPVDVRVVAVDQLDMGFSERTAVPRRLADRIDDLGALTEVLGIVGPTVTVAHDWGGPVSLGWAQRHRDQLTGIVLCNTAVHQPPKSPAPALIRAVRAPGVLRRVTVDTSAFVRGAVAMARPAISADVRAGYLAPYRQASRRQAIGDFVEDIPLDALHPTRGTLDTVAAGLAELGDVPALLLWGPSDPVFSDLYLHDLEARLPHAEVHRFVGAGHLVPEEANVAGAVHAWIQWHSDPRPGGSTLPERVQRPPLWAQLHQRAQSDEAAVVEFPGNGAAATSISFSGLYRRVESLARGLVDFGVCPGDRVALMVPPGVDLTVVLYACWRMGAVMVLVDSGLGARNMSRALTSAAPDYLIGVTRAMTAAKALRWPGRRIAVTALGDGRRRALGIATTTGALEARGAAAAPVLAPDDDAPAAIVFTSGSTGPSKGVLYRHHQLQAQRDLIAELYGIGPTDRLVAAFAPFALYGPALGITSCVPEMDVTRPATLTAAALGAAAVAVEPTLVFASPAALVNIVATADGLSPAHRRALQQVRVLLSAGAPVGPDLLEAALHIVPGAEAHTPYGMTEVLPVADVSLAELRGQGAGNGVCVGRPAPGVAIAISEVDDRGHAVGPLTTNPGITGEVIVDAAHLKESYDRLWYTQWRSTVSGGWHRTGDVGSFDETGRLWIGGRLEHVITSAGGPLLPVAIEQAAERVIDVRRTAAVGVGPVGAQVVVVVVERTASSSWRPRRLALARWELADQVRRVVRADVAVGVAAVLVASELPVDQRHNSKIDRTDLAARAAVLVSGNGHRRR